MTTAEPPPPAAEPEDDYNLAARVYGEAATDGRATEAPSDGTDGDSGNGRDGGNGGVERPYNLAGRIYGDGDAEHENERRGDR